MRPPGTLLFRLIDRWWDPADVAQVASPLLADVQAEWAAARAARHRGRAMALRWSGYVQLLHAWLALGASRRWQRLGRQDAWVLSPLILLGLLGAWVVYTGRLGARQGPAQLLWVAVGVGATVSVATTTARQLRVLAPVSAVVSLLVLGAVPLLAVSDPVRGRWLRLGPHIFHAALLMLPLLYVALAGLAERPGWFAVLLVAVLGLLALEPNLPVVALVALGAIAVAWCSPTRKLALALGATGLAVALLRAPAAHAAAHQQQLWAQLQRLGWFALVALAASTAWLAWTMVALYHRPRRAPALDPLARAATLGIPAQVVVLALADGAVPLLTYGGSATVALFATLGLALAAGSRGCPGTIVH